MEAVALPKRPTHVPVIRLRPWPSFVFPHCLWGSETGTQGCPRDWETEEQGGKDFGLQPCLSSVPFLLCDLGQAPGPPRASVSLPAGQMAGVGPDTVRTPGRWPCRAVRHEPVLRWEDGGWPRAHPRPIPPPALTVSCGGSCRGLMPSSREATLCLERLELATSG